MKQLLTLLIMSLFFSCKSSTDVAQFVDDLPELSLPFKTHEYFCVNPEKITLNSAQSEAVATLFATAEEKLGKYNDDFLLVRMARLKTTGHGKLLVATTIDDRGPGEHDIYLLVLDEEYKITDVKRMRFYNEFCTPNNSLTRETEISGNGEIVIMEYLDKLQVRKNTYIISDKYTIEEVKKPGTTAKSYEVFNSDVCIARDFVWRDAAKDIESVSAVRVYKFDFDVNQWREVPLYIGQLYKEIFFEYADASLFVEGGGGDYPILCKQFDKTTTDGMKIGVWTVKSGYDCEKSDQEAYSTHELIAYAAKDDKIFMLERTSSLPQRADDYLEDALPNEINKMLIRGNRNEITLNFSPKKGITVDSLVLFKEDFDENENVTAEWIGILGKKALADRHLNDLNQAFFDSISIDYQLRQSFNPVKELNTEMENN